MNKLWGRFIDDDIKNAPWLLKTCAECKFYSDGCPYVEKLAIEKYGNSPACSLFEEVSNERTD